MGSWKSSWIVAHWCCRPIASLIWMSIWDETEHRFLMSGLHFCFSTNLILGLLDTSGSPSTFLWTELVTNWFLGEAAVPNCGQRGPASQMWGMWVTKAQDSVCMYLINDLAFLLLSAWTCLPKANILLRLVHQLHKNKYSPKRKQSTLNLNNF